MSAQDRRQLSRDELLDAARSVVARKGLLAMTIGDIAEEAGCAPGTIYLYFESRLELAYELARGFDMATSDGAPAADGDTTTVDRERIHRAVARFWADFRDRLPLAVGAFQLAMIEPGFNAEWAAIRHRVTQRLARSIRRSATAGTPFDVDAVASAISVTLFHGAVTAHYFKEPPIGDDGSDDTMIAALTDLWFRSIASGPGGS